MEKCRRAFNYFQERAKSRTGTAFRKGMQLSPALSPRSRISTQTVPQRNARQLGYSPSVAQGSREANAEIHAYIATRDMALMQAERAPTDLSLNRAFLANELVESFLQPVRSPYQAQGLAATEVMRERQRCEAVKHRVSQLRTCAILAA